MSNSNVLSGLSFPSFSGSLKSLLAYKELAFGIASIGSRIFGRSILSFGTRFSSSDLTRSNFILNPFS